MLQVTTPTIERMLRAAGQALRAGDFARAGALFRQVVTLVPEAAATWTELGRTLAQAGQLAEAEAALRRAVALQPDAFVAYNDLGVTLELARRPQEAVAAFERAIALAPGYVPAHNNLGNCLKWMGRLEEAEAAYRQAIAADPNVAEPYNNLAALLNMMGRCAEALDAYRRAMQMKPSLDVARTGYLYTLHFVAEQDPTEMLAEHRQWDAICAAPWKALMRPLDNDRSPERRLRVGYVSADFRDHPVASFLENLLIHHDRQAVEVFCYAEPAAADAVTARLQRLADAWRTITNLPHEQAAQLIRQDRIDILIDLHGHTAGNRLPVFAQKPAPVQVTYLGYPDTTGLSTIDYRLTDALADPTGPADGWHTEKLVRLPDTFLCCHPPENAPAIEPRPHPLTFASFNAVQKVSPAVVELWAEILRRVPAARLLLKGLGLQEAAVQRHILTLFAQHGISAERLALHGRIGDPRAHLDLYQQVDVALDTFPYHGTTTTCEALWMGVPVVTLAGHIHCSRVGVSLLTSVGLPELIAPTRDDYIASATRLAEDSARRAEYRRTLRQRMAASVLMDSARFARRVEEAYRQMWRTWCAAPC